MAMQRANFTEDHELFRDVARRFFQNEIAPHAEQWRAQGHVDRSAYLKAGEVGLLLTWAENKYGGAEANDIRFEHIVSEENMRHGDPGFYIHLHSSLVAPYIGGLGTEAQKERWLPKCVSGETILAVAMTEPHAGSDLAALRTKAVRQSDGSWLLSGSKTYISNGQLADLIVVAARTSSTSKHGIGLFVVEAGMEGFSRGKRLEKMGLEAQDTSELFFENVGVPAENVLGDPELGFRYLLRFLADERIVAAVAAIAAAQTAFDITLQYCLDRTAFGRPIGTFQNARFELARMRAEIDCVQSFVDACMLQQNAKTLTAETAAAAKYMATELEGRVMDRCVQLHGGAGYMKEYRICRMYTDARVSRIFAGSSEIMLEVIGRGLGLDERRI